ncbi:MAG: hypothetical protein ACREJL_09250, partial [Candidatus Methylomirabilales bacterium]
MLKGISIEDQASFGRQEVFQKLIFSKQPRELGVERWDQRQNLELGPESPKEWKRHKEVADPGVRNKDNERAPILLNEIPVRAWHSQETEDFRHDFGAARIIHRGSRHVPDSRGGI